MTTRSAPLQILFKEPVPPETSRWSVRDHLTEVKDQGPYETSCKHTTLVYVPKSNPDPKVAGRILQCGGDYSAPVIYSANGMRWAWANNRREIHSARADQPTFRWRLDQPIFGPAGECDGPWLGPDQVWFWLRTAVEPNELWVGAGYYRSDFGGANALASGQSGEHGYAFRANLPGWWRNANQRKKIAGNEPIPTGADPAMYFKRMFGTGSEPDKFAAYDPVTDSAYCINDNFEVLRFDHAKGDWDRCPTGTAWTAAHVLHRYAKDDLGRDLWHQYMTASIGGSFQVRVGRKILALGVINYPRIPDLRHYLVWYDIDTQKVGAYTMPVPIDPNWTQMGPDGKPLYTGNPEEHSFIVSWKDRYVIAMIGTHPGCDPNQDEPWKLVHRDVAVPEQVSEWLYMPGNRPMWKFDTVTGKWENGEKIPFWIAGNSMVAVEDEGYVAVMGSTAHTTGYTNPPPAYLYRID